MRTGIRDRQRGYIEFQPERWEYKYGRNIIEFGGGTSQPQTNAELYEMCEDVIDVAKKYSAQLIYTVGAFHTSRYLSKQPKHSSPLHPKN